MVLNNKKISDLYYNNENILRDLKDDEKQKFKLNLNYTLEKKEKKIIYLLIFLIKLLKKLNYLIIFQKLKKLTKKI